jgi:(p)ppGpp synthase/HD superfamily hydrolase
MKVLNAARIASEWHAKQRRKGAAAEPYVNHLIEVADLVAAVGAAEDIVCAALLHDAIEDQDVSAAMIADRFGPYVASLVCEVTDDKALPKAERKAAQIAAAPHLSPGAKLIKLADKISNVRSIASSPPADWPLQRRLDYIEFCCRVVAGLRGANAVLEETFDLDARAAWEASRSEIGSMSAASRGLDSVSGATG